MSSEARRSAAEAADAVNKAVSHIDHVIQGRYVYEMVAMSAREGASDARMGLEAIGDFARYGDIATHDIIEDAKEARQILVGQGEEAASTLDILDMAITDTGSLTSFVVGPAETIVRENGGIGEQIETIIPPATHLDDMVNGSRADLILGELMTRDLEENL